MYKMYYQGVQVQKLYFNNLRGGSVPSVDALTSLFTGGVQGGYYDPNDLSTVFQDVEGLVPVTAPNQTVAKILDRSGNGNHLIQPTVSKQPKLVYNVAKNTYGLSFDGIDDSLYINTLTPSGDEWTLGYGIDLIDIISNQSSIIFAKDISATTSQVAIGLVLSTNYDSFYSAGTVIFQTQNSILTSPNQLNPKLVVIGGSKKDTLLNVRINDVLRVATNPIYVGVTITSASNNFVIGHGTRGIMYKSFFIGKTITDTEKTSVYNLIKQDYI